MTFFGQLLLRTRCKASKENFPKSADSPEESDKCNATAGQIDLAQILAQGDVIAYHREES